MVQMSYCDAQVDVYNPIKQTVSNTTNPLPKRYAPKACPQFPEEIIEMILQYMDIPSISNISQTCKQTKYSLFSTLAVDDDTTWLRLVELRFNLENLKRKNPKTYGGITWKSAYLNLMHANRIPKCRLLTGKGKVVFAKPFHAFRNVNHRNKTFYNQKTVDHKDDKDHQGISLWVSIGHTADCNTRHTTRGKWNALQEEDEKYHRSFSMQDLNTGNLYCGHRSTTGRIYHSNRTNESQHGNNRNSRRQRFIELHLCLQNTKSSNGCVHVDFSEAFIQQISKLGNELNDVHVQNCGKYKPKVLYHSGNKTKYMNSRHQNISRTRVSYSTSGCTTTTKLDMTRSQSCHYRLHFIDYKNNKKSNSLDCVEHETKSPYQLTLNPLEFAIVAVNVPCTPDMIYETDFLSRSLVAHVPTMLNCYTPLHKENSQYVQDMNDIQNNPSSKRKSSDMKWVKETRRTLTTATFLTEMEFWDYYMQLPGGCLALSDCRRSAFD